MCKVCMKDTFRIHNPWFLFNKFMHVQRVSHWVQFRLFYAVDPDLLEKVFLEKVIFCFIEIRSGPQSHFLFYSNFTVFCLGQLNIQI